jgi:hypothetical protein
LKGYWLFTIDYSLPRLLHYTGILFSSTDEKNMVRMPTALAIVGIVVIILGTWMMLNDTISGRRTLYAGIALEILAVLMILFRSAKKRKSPR